MNRSAVAVVVGVGLAGLAVGCSAESDADGDAIRIVASTTHLTDIATNVAGERAEVIGIAPANADPHDFEPRPSDVQSVADADLVLASGGDLDLWLEDLVESSGSTAEVVTILDSIPALAGEHADHAHEEEDVEEEHEDEAHESAYADQEVDPHWWQDPRNAVIATGVIRDHLIELDPEGEEAYRENARTYTDTLDTLDREIAACMRAIPRAQRRLVTTHDALGYFAERYDIEIVGSLIPALSTQAQSSLGETDELVDLIRAKSVSAVFPEAGLDAELERAVTDEAGAEIGGELWSDTLGPDDSGGATYIEAMSHNANSLAAGFTGEEAPCQIAVGTG